MLLITHHQGHYGCCQLCTRIFSHNLLNAFASVPALAFLPSASGNDTGARPARQIFVNGSDAHFRPGAPANEPPTVIHRNLANKRPWDPSPPLPGRPGFHVVEVSCEWCRNKLLYK